MVYELIKDEQRLIYFIDNVLPDEGDGFMISLFARKKYDTTGTLKADKSQIKRVTSTKDGIIQKIRQMECKIGSYLYDNQPVPEESLALYITPSPRDYHKAGLQTLKEIADKLQRNLSYNPKSLALNCIQTCGHGTYFDLDIDMVDPEPIKIANTLDRLTEMVNEDALHFILTRGGLHCLV